MTPEGAARAAGSGRAGAGPEAAWLHDAVRLLAEAGHAPECRACPLCRGIAVLRDLARQLGPDLLDQVARVATDLAISLREQGVREAPPAPSGESGVPDGEPSWWGRPPGTGDVPRTERIDITD